MTQTSTQMVTVTIDGRQVTVPKGMLLVDVAKRIGIDIPIFCYHPKMQPAGACRMCLVEVEKMPRLQTACTTPVADGMVVHTRNAGVDEARRGVLEFLLINHPLDCPVCDKGGECPLQDNTFIYGPGDSRFIEEKRHFVKPIELSEHVVLDRERCIMCFRCVRFCRELAGDESLTVLDRGTFSEIGLAPGRVFDSPFSGNTIELCPVGALTSRHYRFRARPWDLRRTASVCSLCSVGCNVLLDTRKGEALTRIVARENTPVDDGWLCDRGRFTYEWVGGPDRLKTPLVRRQGELVPATWPEAIEAAAAGLRAAIERHGAPAVGGVASARCTNEELYLFQKLFRAAIGSNNVDHGFGRRVVPNPLGFDAAGGSIGGLEQAGAILVLGANPIVEQPVLDLRLKKASRFGARLVVVGPEQIDLVGYGRQWLRLGPEHYPDLVNALGRAIVDEGLQSDEFIGRRTRGYEGLKAELSAHAPAEVGERIGLDPEGIRSAARLIAGGKTAILYPRDLLIGDYGRRLAAALANLALLTANVGVDGAGLYGLVREANSQGAIDLGLAPDRLPGQFMLADAAAREALSGQWGRPIPEAPGLGGAEMLAAAGEAVRALYLVGVDPVGQGMALGRLDFLAVQDVFLTPTARRADVVLPGVSFAEKQGTYTNLERRVQLLRAAVRPPGQARPDWEIVQDLTRALGGASAYADSHEVMAEIAEIASVYGGISYTRVGLKGVQWPMSADRTAGTAALYSGEERVWDFVSIE